MGLSKSEIWKKTEELKSIISEAISTIKKNLDCIRAGKGSIPECKNEIDEAWEKLDNAVGDTRDLIIDSDNYFLAVEINDKVSLILKEYWIEANKGAFEVHEAAQNTLIKLNNIRKWMRGNAPKPSAKQFINVLGAMTRNCLMYLESKYDLRYTKNRNVITTLSEYMQRQIDVVWPVRIACGFDEGIITLANLNLIMEEIETNIVKFGLSEELKIYVVKLLEPFRIVSDQKAIFENENYEKQRATIDKEKAILGTPENGLRFLLSMTDKYARKLYAALIQRGFDLGQFQKEVGINLETKWTWVDIAPYVGGKERAQHFMEQQETQAVSPSTEVSKKEKTPVKKVVDREKMAVLFEPAFFNLDFRPKDSVINDDNKKLFNAFCDRLDLLLSNNDNNSMLPKPFKKYLSQIVYMIYCNKFTKDVYHNNGGKTGHFPKLLELFFEAIAQTAPSDNHPGKYDEPDERIVDVFGDILQWNIQKNPIETKKARI